MIDLLKVKLQKEYDFIQETPPEAIGTWLCTADNGDYKAGYSYDVTQDDSVFTYTRTEQAQDFKALAALYPTIELICHYLNNWFIAHTYYGCRGCHVQKLTRNFADNTISPVADIKVNDLIRVDGVRNRYVSYVTGTTTNGVQIDNAYFTAASEPAAIDFMVLPAVVETLIAQVINYDIFVRGGVSDGVTGETVGNYRYSIDDTFKRIGSLDYPGSVVSALEGYRKIRAY